jgi:hypothetical protein
MATDTATASRSLGGRDALSVYRADRAEARLRLRVSLRAGREALRVGRNVQADPQPVEVPEAPVAHEASIFAQMVDASIPRTPQVSEAGDEPVACSAPPPIDADASDVADEVHAVTSPASADITPVPDWPDDLTAIPELEPGMRIRLSQLGIQDVDDLAQSDPVELRKNLGEISRLLRVERWIEAAIAIRQAAMARTCAVRA